MPDPIDPGTNSLLRLIIIVFLVLAICGSLGGSWWGGFGNYGYGGGGLLLVILILILLGV
jgi:hypothetical protein